jgi:hypothetical protein
MNTIDHVYYINLDYRSDRRLQFEDWIEESGFPAKKVTRVSATSVPGRGHIGCLLSHIKTLEEFLKLGHNNCLVLEDDYIPVDIKTFWNNFEALEKSKIEYDIVMCAYNVLEYEEGPVDYLKKVKSSFTSSGYLITKSFAPILIENFKEAVHKCIEQENVTKQKANEYCLDVYWQKLMPLSKWYCFYPRIGIQRESYSDIQGHVTAYNA